MKKYAVISFTPDDNYAFFAPIVHWCWNRIGIGTSFTIPQRMVHTSKLDLILKYTRGAFYTTFESPEYKEATYAQVSRLYDTISPYDISITSDVDMAVFRDDFPENESFNILGYDLVPDNQYPICYSWANGDIWQRVMETNGGRTLQECLDEQLGHIECDHFRGNQWSFDQGLLYRQVSLMKAPSSLKLHPRARPGTQFAANRADRDDINWMAYTGPTLLDAHLWRPGYEETNFARILALLQIQYPDDDFGWLQEYRNQYIHLL